MKAPDRSRGDKDGQIATAGFDVMRAAFEEASIHSVDDLKGEGDRNRETARSVELRLALGIAALGAIGFLAWRNRARIAGLFRGFIGNSEVLPGTTSDGELIASKLDETRATGEGLPDRIHEVDGSLGARSAAR